MTMRTTRRRAGIGPGLKNTLWVSGALLWLSGVVWCLVHYTVGGGTAEGLPHPAEAWLLRLHGLAMFIHLPALGAIIAQHHPAGWHMSQRPPWHGQRRSGLALAGALAILVLTAYLLYYFGADTVRPAIGWGHAIVGGLALPGLFGVHQRHKG